jgi:hypothetical protein
MTVLILFCVAIAASLGGILFLLSRHMNEGHRHVVVEIDNPRRAPKAEPPLSSVVVDLETQDAFQRTSDGWFLAGDETAWAWRDMQDAYPRLTVVWTP